MKKLLVVLAAALLATGIVATRLWMQLRDEREQNSTLQARVSALETQASVLRAAASVVPAPAASAAPQTADTPAAPRPRPAPATEALAAGIRQMMTSPEGRAMTRATLRRLLPTQYPDIGKELHLSPEEVDKLFDLLAKQQSDQVDMATDTARSGQPAQDLQRRFQEKRQADDAELAAMLGGKYPQYQSYQETLPARRQVDQLQAVLASGANGLSDAQARNLMTALAGEQTRINQDARNVPPPAAGGNPQDAMQQQLQRTDEDNRRLLNAASAQLNPEQLDSYKRMLDQQQNLRRVLIRAVGQQGTQGQAPAPAAP